MSRSGEVRLQLGLDERTFRLGLKQWERLDEELEIGPPVLAARLAMGEAQAKQVLGVFPALVGEIGRWRHNDARLVLYQGLLGAGMKADDASKIVARAAEDMGLIDLAVPAYTVVMAGMSGVSIEDAAAGEPEGAQPDRPPSPTDGSDSAGTASTP